MVFWKFEMLNSCIYKTVLQNIPIQNLPTRQKMAGRCASSKDCYDLNDWNKEIQNLRKIDEIFDFSFFRQIVFFTAESN